MQGRQDYTQKASKQPQRLSNGQRRELERLQEQIAAWERRQQYRQPQRVH